jgi:PBP1b-binding outer membrane lipoprotein LpoB
MFLYICTKYAHIENIINNNNKFSKTMKKLFAILSMAFVALFVLSCEKPAPAPAPEPEPEIPSEVVSPEDFNIDIQIKDIKATSAIATATPNGMNRY